MTLDAHATIATYVFDVYILYFQYKYIGIQAYYLVLLSTPSVSINTASCPPKTEDSN